MMGHLPVSGRNRVRRETQTDEPLSPKARNLPGVSSFVAFVQFCALSVQFIAVAQKIENNCAPVLL